MSNTNIVSKKLTVSTAENFVQSVQSDSSYYVFAAKHTPYDSSDENIPLPTDSVADNTIDIYNNMVFGKKVGSSDVIEMVPRYDWTSGTTYTMYDDQDTELLTSQFYATVNAGSQYHVYKCLYNGANAASIVEPSGTDATAFESPSDGYVWKYMYSANSVIMNKFATTEYMPIVANSLVTEAAIPGTVEVIKVEDAGLGYDNYLLDSFRSASDLRVGGSPLLYSIGPNASTLNDFYNGCIIYITSGAAQGEYSIITDYYIDGEQKVIVLNEAFENIVAVNDTYEIYPYVYVFDTGGVKQSNCIARAIVSNTSGNSISKIDIIQPGSGYRSATAVILPANIVSVDASADLRAIISPPGGHGSNVKEELGANFAAVSVKFIQNEEVLTTENDYRQVGILKQPLFANVALQINIANTVGAFAAGEQVYEYRAVQLTGSVEVSSNTTVVGSSTEFDAALTVGDRLLITDGTSNLLANVAAVGNSTSLTIASNASFTAAGCTVSLLTLAPFGIVSGNTAGEILLTNVSTTALLGTNRFIGEDSYCTTTANTDAPIPIGVNGRAPNNFNSFTQLTKFVGTLNGVTPFLEDETVTQTSVIPYAQPSAKFHSFIENGATDEMYVTTVQNIFRTSADVGSDGVVTGSNSSSTFTITAKYNGELVPDSGKILYLENLHPISRANTQTETIKIILEF